MHDCTCSRKIVCTFICINIADGQAGGGMGGGKQGDEGVVGGWSENRSAAPADSTTAPPQWRKSRFSNPSGDCVEVARLASGEVGVRNSRDRTGPLLAFTVAELDAFVRGVKAGEFDDLVSGLRRPQRSVDGAASAAPSGSASGRTV